MSFFLLPNNNNDITPSDFNIILNNKPNLDKSRYISHALNSYIGVNKSKIEGVQTEWDNVKKYTNPYEFIHTPVPYSKMSVAKYKPISRSYFKFVELAGMLSLLESFNYSKINSFHLAEGPGGFIEALANMRNNTADTYTGMTLISNNTNVPGWRKSQDVLNKYSNIKIETGMDNTGDILNPENFKHCYNKYKNSMDIITADGGFDFSIDFNMQEILSSRLVVAEALYAIIMQRRGGNYILKIFDSFSYVTCEVLYLLSCFYQRVYIVKPNTSRYANSERYIVCKNFKYTSIEPLFSSLYEIMTHISDDNLFINNILAFKIPYMFILKIEEINSVIGQQQIESIENTLNLIHHKNKNDKLELLKKNNINKCVNWCVKYRQSYNKIMSHTNIFQSASATEF